MVAGIWLSSHDRNLAAQLKTVLAMTPCVLDKRGGVNLCMVDNRGRKRPPVVVSAEEKGLESALGEAMDKGEEKEGGRDPVQRYSQILRVEV